VLYIMAVLLGVHPQVALTSRKVVPLGAFRPFLGVLQAWQKISLKQMRLNKPTCELFLGAALRSVLRGMRWGGSPGCFTL
jgi:hypothetical protein